MRLCYESLRNDTGKKKDPQANIVDFVVFDSRWMGSLKRSERQLELSRDDQRVGRCICKMRLFDWTPPPPPSPIIKILGFAYNCLSQVA